MNRTRKKISRWFARLFTSGSSTSVSEPESCWPCTHSAEAKARARANELIERMGTRYLFHPANRIKRKTTTRNTTHQARSIT